VEDQRPIIDKFELQRDHGDQLVLTDETGHRYVGVEVIRAFPLSDPEHAISICDSGGREIVHLDSLGNVSGELRRTLEAELSRREFVPIIRRILNDPPDTEPTDWKVETDRGVTVFQLDREEDVHRNDANQVTIVDTHGIRFLIPDPSGLDVHSRRVLDRFL
jgi:hypothetical protein